VSASAAGSETDVVSESGKQSAGSGGGADPATAAAAQPEGQQQHEEQVRKLLALLSCLVAILKATCDMPGAKQLVLGALDFHEKAHQRMSALAAAATVAAALPDTCWSAAATSLAGSMLALWEAVVEASSKQQAEKAAVSSPAQADAAIAAAPRDSNSTGAAGESGSATEQQGEGVVDAVAAAAGVEGSAPGVAAAGLDVAAVSERTWALVLATLQLPLLPAEDAVGLLGSISRAVTLVGAAVAAVGSNGSTAIAAMSVVLPTEASTISTVSITQQPGSKGVGKPYELQGAEAEQGHADVSAAVPVSVPVDLWSATHSYRWVCVLTGSDSRMRLMFFGRTGCTGLACLQLRLLDSAAVTFWTVLFILGYCQTTCNRSALCMVCLSC
jgi:hypothetical protein